MLGVPLRGMGQHWPPGEDRWFKNFRLQKVRDYPWGQQQAPKPPTAAAPLATPPPDQYLDKQQCHQCDLRPLFNQYDCLSLCVQCATPCYAFLCFWPIVCARMGVGRGEEKDPIGKGWAMYRLCSNFGLKSTWRRRVCCIVAEAFARRQGQQHEYGPGEWGGTEGRRQLYGSRHAGRRSQSTLTRGFNAFLCHFLHCAALESHFFCVCVSLLQSVCG